MTSINLYCDNSYEEFVRLVWLLIPSGAYIRDAWAIQRGYCVVCDVPSWQVDGVLDSWLGA